MRKYAILNNGVVTEIRDIDDDDIVKIATTVEMLIDVTDAPVCPVIGYVLNGNKLELPQNLSSREQFEIELNSRKSDFGTKLSRNAVDRIGARNKILNKNGQQVITLLTQLLGVKSLLETGALGTARASCASLKLVYTEYEDIFNYVINEINSFESSFGL